MKILTPPERACRRGPEAWFSGEVWIDAIAAGEAPSHLNAALVTFTPGARTAWHSHPLGQTLYILSGLGWVQSHGEPARPVRPGDVIVFAPGEVHWHGAQRAHTFVHLALQEADAQGTTASWGDKVTEAVYDAAAT